MSRITCPVDGCSKETSVLEWTHRAGTYDCGCGTTCLTLSWAPAKFGGRQPAVRVAIPEEAQAYRAQAEAGDQA